MKKMMVVLSLACLPILAHAQLKGIKPLEAKQLFQFSMQGLNRAQMATIKARADVAKAAAQKAAAAKKLVVAAKKVNSPQMPARRYEGQMEFVDKIGLNSPVPKLDEYTFFTREYSSAFDAQVYVLNPGMPIFHSAYINYSMTWDLCQRYIEKVSKLLQTPQKQNHQPKITPQDALELLAEGEGVQWSLRHFVGSSMRKADDAMMKMDSALSDILNNLGVIAGKSSSSLPLPVDPSQASKMLKARILRGLPLR